MIAPLRETADRLLRRDAGVGLDEFVARSRSNGAGWAEVADELAAATSGVLVISYESLRQWFGPPARAA